ncbi:sensor domain-containing diguanylate cyclase [Halomonas daqiaonensis]|uniref:PAS domain S-box-containing protein/diguanylate cyclase (GGDEF) domain-containing protein n=1 Tax=Halomonas daqiaonensis TaxID=650850 RepID=A0A1H7GTX9_9GAMM|nr:diguanylate cyclase [Halomonas daqiaonensis]SEK41633.1 PAS domain S-box-containing protein/diguanylate cyclase (GGDEF) domain-containing protein [Halomonas daqiaonensis]
MKLRSARFLRHALHRHLFSLRGRLLLGVVVIWTLLSLTLLALGWQSGTLLVEESNRVHLQYEADLISNDITQEIEQRLEVLERLAGQLQDASPGTLAEGNHNALLALFEGLVVVNAENIVIDDWPTLEGRIGRDIGHRSYARFMRNVQRPHVSEPFVGEVSGRTLVMMLVPRHDEQGRYAGFLGGLVEVDHSQLFEGFDRLRLGDEGHVVIATASGQLLYHPDQRQGLPTLDKGARDPWLDLALYGWEGEASGELHEGSAALSAYRQIWPADWIVALYLPVDQVYAPLASVMERIAWRALWVLGLLLPVMAALIWLALRPLTRLAHQIKDLGRGRRRSLQIATRMHELRRVIDVFNEVEHERVKTMQDLQQRKAFLKGILAASPQGMFVTDTQGRLTFVNRALKHLLGIKPPVHLPTWAERIHDEDRAPLVAAWQACLLRHKDFVRQFRYHGEKGEMIWLDVHANAIRVDGEIIGLVGIVRDITQRQHEDALRRWEAEHDPLTGLLNRRGFQRRLEEAFTDWEKAATPSALLMFDLDHFKAINDAGGHALGDNMLHQVTAAMAAETRSSDHNARHGGDEFAILLPGCDVSQAMRIAESLRARIAANGLEQHGQTWRVTVSIGVSNFQPTDQTVDDVVERADQASYTAKTQGRNSVVSA